MIFENLSVFQNVLFLIAALGVALVIIYLICYYSGLTVTKKTGISDDFDHAQEEDDDPAKFWLNALTLKGSVFFVGTMASVSFCLTLIVSVWLSLVIGGFVGLGVAFLIAFFDRDKKQALGLDAIVSENIAAEGAGVGKIILQEDGSEIDAMTLGKALKKGKKVVIVEEKGNIVVVKKFKRRAK